LFYVGVGRSEKKWVSVGRSGIFFKVWEGVGRGGKEWVRVGECGSG